MSQILLFPDARPLVERLGRGFFRELPETPGVYLMRDGGESVLYVGKAKNLRKRLGSYRVANPDRMPPRHLRLVRAVERIDIEECADENAALAREAHLLRTLRPKFNRAGTWVGTPKFLAWKLSENTLHLAVTDTPEPGWRIFPSRGAGPLYMRIALVRLLWFVMYPSQGISGMPAGWFDGHYGEHASFNFGGDSDNLRSEISEWLDALFAGKATEFGDWVLSKASAGLPLFEQMALAENIEFLAEAFA